MQVAQFTSSSLAIISNSNSERKKDPSLDSAEDKSVQDWDLKDVIFVEDKRNIPVGKVLKVNIQIALVHEMYLAELIAII